MLVFSNEAPWLDYLIIDDDGNRKLQDDTPQDIKEAYQKHLTEVENWKQSWVETAI